MNEGIPPEKTIQHFDLTFSKVRQGFCSSVISLLCLWLAVLAMDTQAMASDDIIAENAEGFFDISFGDLTEELGLLEEEGKKAILVMFETEDCPWCTRMKQQVLNRVAVQKYFHEHFRVISIDAEGDVPIIDFQGNELPSKTFALKTLRVRATPVFAFFGRGGELITRYTGALKNAHDFLLLGRYVAEEHYENGSFKRFRRANQ